MDLNINYSSNIERYAKMRGKNMKQVLELIDLSSSSYYGMKDKNQFSTKTLEKFASVLHVEISDLVKSPHNDKKKTMQSDFDKIKDSLKNFEDQHM